MGSENIANKVKEWHQSLAQEYQDHRHEVVNDAYDRLGKPWISRMNEFVDSDQESITLERLLPQCQSRCCCLSLMMFLEQPLALCRHLVQRGSSTPAYGPLPTWLEQPGLHE